MIHQGLVHRGVYCTSMNHLRMVYQEMGANLRHQIRIEARPGRYERLRVRLYDVICELAECSVANLLQKGKL
jgi:hypothetical protein